MNRSRLSTDIYILSGHFEPYSELEMRCMRYGDEVRKLEDELRKLKAAPPLTPDEDWDTTVAEAHESLDRMEGLSLQRLADAFRKHDG